MRSRRCLIVNILIALSNLYEIWYVYHGTSAHFNKSLPSVCVYVYPLSLLGNGSINMFPRKRIHATRDESLEASFSIRSVSYKRRVCVSVCVSPISVSVPPKRWSVDSQSRHTVKCGHGSRRTRTLARRSSNLLDIVARQRLGIHVTATTKYCWRLRFLCGPCPYQMKVGD
jgi:hypothetical protein